MDTLEGSISQKEGNEHVVPESEPTSAMEGEDGKVKSETLANKLGNDNEPKTNLEMDGEKNKSELVSVDTVEGSDGNGKPNTNADVVGENNESAHTDHIDEEELKKQEALEKRRKELERRKALGEEKRKKMAEFEAVRRKQEEEMRRKKKEKARKKAAKKKKQKEAAEAAEAAKGEETENTTDNVKEINKTAEVAISEKPVKRAQKKKSKNNSIKKTSEVSNSQTTGDKHDLKKKGNRSSTGDKHDIKGDLHPTGSKHDSKNKKKSSVQIARKKHSNISSSNSRRSSSKSPSVSSKSPSVSSPRSSTKSENLLSAKKIVFKKSHTDPGRSKQKKHSMNKKSKPTEVMEQKSMTSEKDEKRLKELAAIKAAKKRIHEIEKKKKSSGPPTLGEAALKKAIAAAQASLKKPDTANAESTDSEIDHGKNNQNEKPTKKKGAAPRFPFCYSCNQQFSVRSLGAHYVKCLKMRQDDLALIPKQFRPSLPNPPKAPFPYKATDEELMIFNAEAQKIFSTHLPRCPHENCRRSFEANKIIRHIKSCPKRLDCSDFHCICRLK